ncbi:MAG: ADP-dependent (S)-NAD(P)H-hydrate dehydratase [uncultured Nocardioidaceae bacterium]|uniref:ADP-dependent (S)-NAD(P)H-hydrate dehydratase n=1 Tax=uncultured Nocardioidaceae bacterium TaxID=253824 RepID=A0A6J4NNQ8_9ACTN|nr:MAG: ADP-dependent (S)-NAD(P)H-hydrate dehydratase [uncultured Nocardioidaceae bacterium]
MTANEPVLVTSGTLHDWPLPEPGSDKEARGRVVVVGGSRGTPGAVLLAGEAALRAGGGKLQLATAESACTAIAVAVPESMVIPLPETSEGCIGTAAADLVVEEAEGADVVLLGPGLVGVDDSLALIEGILPRLDTTVVIDALASAYVTAHPDGLRHLGGRCVLTVNPTELARILDRDEDEVSGDPLEAARDTAELVQAVVLCGGSEKAVATPDGAAWLVQVGGPGLGVSGSGDTQSGIVAGLLARGAEPAQAAVWGAFLHGRAGEQLAVSVGAVGFLAREIPGRVPGLLAELGG